MKEILNLNKQITKNKEINKEKIKKEAKTAFLNEEYKSFAFLRMKPRIRDGPLKKLWWRWGIFELQEFFFVIKFLV